MKSVMIVEDDADIRDILQEILKFESYATMTAGNGKEALELLTQTKNLPDLILLDLMMPVMNGWEFSENIKQHTDLAKIPIIIVSAFADKAHTIDSIGFIEKPIVMNNLLSVLKHYLKAGTT